MESEDFTVLMPVLGDLVRCVDNQKFGVLDLDSRRLTVGTFKMGGFRGSWNIGPKCQEETGRVTFTS